MADFASDPKEQQELLSILEKLLEQDHIKPEHRTTISVNFDTGVISYGGNDPKIYSILSKFADALNTSIKEGFQITEEIDFFVHGVNQYGEISSADQEDGYFTVLHKSEAEPSRARGVSLL